MSHKVTQRLLTGAEVLETNDWAGRYIPLVPVYGEEVNVEGKRYLRSLIRDAKDPQRMFNYWRTTTTELVALSPKAPFIGPKGAFQTDQAKWETANTDTHAYIEYDGNVPPQRQAFAGVPAGALQEALNASDDMKAIIGMYDASLGARSNETSGRAILARQREGDVSTFHFIDNLSRAIEHAGRILIDLIPKVYTGERIVRVLGQDGAAASVQLGKPVVEIGPDGQPATNPVTGQPLSRISDFQKEFEGSAYRKESIQYAYQDLTHVAGCPVLRSDHLWDTLHLDPDDVEDALDKRLMELGIDNVCWTTPIDTVEDYVGFWSYVLGTELVSRVRPPDHEPAAMNAQT